MYTRQQLMLLLILVGAAGVGFAVMHWRAAHPELVERLEQIDREPPGASDAASAAPAQPARITRPRRPDGDGAGTRPRRSAASPRVPKREAIAGDEPRVPLDLNQATVVELRRLPGVGAVLARRIVETREAAGRFAAVDDLGVVPGLRRSTLERLRSLVGVGE
jgi:competence ComEA-like helix-hairpin-helix protein